MCQWFINHKMGRFEGGSVGCRDIHRPVHLETLLSPPSYKPKPPLAPKPNQTKSNHHQQQHQQDPKTALEQMMYLGLGGRQGETAAELFELRGRRRGGRRGGAAARWVGGLGVWIGVGGGGHA